MSKNATMNRLNSLLDQIGQTLLAYTNEQMQGEAWLSAYLDVRSAISDNNKMEKYRIKRADGTLLATLDSPDDVFYPLNEAFQLRRKVSDKIWCGLLVTVFPDKPWEIKLNYDP